MTEGIGKALASAIKDEPHAGPAKGRGDIFSNRHRREIFSQLTMRPCSDVAALARVCGISQNSVGWHLDALMKSGYIVKMMFGKCAAYYPDGLITREEAPLFCLINRSGHAEALRCIIKNPGLSRSELAETLGISRQKAARILNALLKAGAIKAVREGANVRQYPTTMLSDRAEGAYQHSRDFSEFIINKLAGSGGAAPAVVKKGLDRMVVELGHASMRFTIEVGINPYITCTAC